MTEAEQERARVRNILRKLSVSACSHLCLREFDTFCCRCTRQKGAKAYSCGHRACDFPVPEGCTVVEDRDDRLLLDYDYDSWVENFVAYLPIKYEVPFRRIHIWPSRRHVHVMIELTKPMPYTKRLQLQMELGSDAGRNFIDLHKTKGLRRNVLFKPIRPELAPVVP